MCESEDGVGAGQGRCSRREFVRTAGGCAAWLWMAGASGPGRVVEAFAARPRGPLQAVEPWARIEELGPGVWAVVSTPLKSNDFKTIANGGVIAGRDGVVAVEGFGSEDGARWVGDQALRLTGRRPTHVVLTHHHGDHSRGQGGYVDDHSRLRVLATAETNRVLERQERERWERETEMKVAFEPERLMPTTFLNAGPGAALGERVTEIDLGDRTVRVTARDGHTSSDVTVEIDEPRVVWCGDLVWNGLFPNYVDAIPSRLTPHVREVLSDPDATYVPGHGDVSDHAGLQSYVGLIEDVGEAATRAFRDGATAEAAAAGYAVPDSLGGWVRFNPRYYEVAFRAWYRDLGG